MPAGRVRPAGAARILRGLKTRELDLVDVESQSASPFSSSLLFDYIATYMYEDDTPPAERRAQALSLDRDLLRELLGQEELRDLLDPGALEEVERSCAAAAQRGRAPRPPAPRGDLREGEYDAGFAETLIRERRAIRIRVAGEERLIAAEDAGRYRDALGVMPPGGLPDAFLTAVEQPALQQLVLRFAKGRGPFTTAEANEHFGRDVEPLLRGARARGEARPRRAPARAAPSASGAIPTCCAACAAPRSPRCARRSSPPSRRRSGASCRAGTGSTAARRCARRSSRSRGSPLPVALWESEVLPRRVPGYQPLQLDQLCASGELVWVGAGLDRVAVFFREDAAVLGRRPPRPPPERRGRGPDPRRARAGAKFWHDLVAAAGLEPAEALPALWELVWAGEVRTTRGRRCARASATRRRAAARARRFSRRRRPTASRPRRAAGR